MIETQNTLHTRLGFESRYSFVQLLKDYIHLKRGYVGVVSGTVATIIVILSSHYHRHSLFIVGVHNMDDCIVNNIIVNVSGVARGMRDDSIQRGDANCKLHA